MRLNKKQSNKIILQAKSSKLKAALGFTLIESLVAVSVFAFAITSIVGVFIAVQRLNQESAALQVVQQNGRFIAEDLTKIIRNGQVDYASYIAGAPQPFTDELLLINSDNEQVRIFLSGSQLRIEKTGAGVSDLTTSEIQINDFKAYITPAEDPFSGGSSLSQPTVTVFLDIEANINARDRVRIPFQITATTRQYPDIN